MLYFKLTQFNVCYFFFFLISLKAFTLTYLLFRYVFRIKMFGNFLKSFTHSYFASTWFENIPLYDINSSQSVEVYFVTHDMIHPEYASLPLRKKSIALFVQ